MKEIGTFEAKTHLSALLDEVARGAEVVITRRGVAVARLVPAGSPRRAGTGDPIARAKTFGHDRAVAVALAPWCGVAMPAVRC